MSNEAPQEVKYVKNADGTFSALSADGERVPMLKYRIGDLPHWADRLYQPGEVIELPLHDGRKDAKGNWIVSPGLMPSVLWEGLDPIAAKRVAAVRARKEANEAAQNSATARNKMLEGRAKAAEAQAMKLEEEARAQMEDAGTILADHAKQLAANPPPTPVPERDEPQTMSGMAKSMNDEQQARLKRRGA